MTFKKILGVAFATFILLSTGCERSKIPPNEVIIGTMEGPETQLLQVAQTQAKLVGLKIKIITFSNYNMPNEALNDGSLNANMFQTIAYLNAAIKAKHYQIVPIGKTFIYPMGIYSQRYRSLSQIPKGLKVAIPNDPSNQARALLLLQAAKLISLKPGTGTEATPHDIISNPLQLKITSMDAAQLPRVLQDVDLAIINANYAVPAGLLLGRDAIYRESPDSPYANVVVVKTVDKDDPRFQKLMTVLHSQAVLEAANTIFQGQALPAW